MAFHWYVVSNSGEKIVQFRWILYTLQLIVFCTFSSKWNSVNTKFWVEIIKAELFRKLLATVWVYTKVIFFVLVANHHQQQHLRIQHQQVGSSHYSTFSISTTLLFSFWVFFISLGKRSSEIPTTVTLTRIFLLHAKTPQMHTALNSMENAARTIHI